MSESRRGLLYGVAAYLMWGFFPLYWALLDATGALELLAARVTFSLLVMALLLAVLRRVAHLRTALRDPRRVALLSVAAVLISVNWFTFIWGVNNGRVIEVSLGYFITPLVSVLLGVAVLGERLRRLQWVAVGIATLAVVVLTADYGRVPWVAVTLAATFGLYGLVKKTAAVGAVESLVYETAVVVPVALGFLAWIGVAGTASYLDLGPGGLLLLASSGVVTALPLICFGAAAVRVSLTTIGLLQYLGPTIHFVLGLTVFDEALPTARLVGFCLVWSALAVFSVEAWRHRRRQLRLAALASSGA